MMPLKNDVLLRALLRQPTDYTPVWLMRQAGRYLPEYNATRKRAGSFLALCKNPELACEVTLQPLERYRLDAAILFSDILTVPDAMGLGLYFAEGEGPRFERPLRDEAEIARLAAPDPMQSLRYVMDAVRTIREALGGRVPLIGFSGSPWTLACYMVEGGGSDDFRTVKTMLYRRPDLMSRILEVNARAVADYLNAQVEAGAQALMIFDSWGGALADGAFQKFSLAPIRQVLEGLRLERDEPEVDASGRIMGTRRVRVPVIVFTKGGGLWLEQIAATGCDAVGVDWTVNLGQARARVGERCAIQGNLDPMVLMAGPEQIRAEALKALESFGVPEPGVGHIFNLGHGISQFTPPESVTALVDSVHAYSREQRRRGAGVSSL
jgi:uroporphyrinogen decarboxylase